MMEFFRDLFYGLFLGSWVICILMTFLFVVAILLILLLVVELVHAAKSGRNVDRFFEQNETKTGRVVAYSCEVREAHTHMLPMRIGLAVAPIPIRHDESATFYVEIECENGNKRFIAKYRIPAEDYKEFAEGSEVMIPATWERWEFEVLD